MKCAPFGATGSEYIYPFIFTYEVDYAGTKLSFLKSFFDAEDGKLVYNIINSNG